MKLPSQVLSQAHELVKSCRVELESGLEPSVEEWREMVELLCNAIDKITTDTKHNGTTVKPLTDHILLKDVSVSSMSPFYDPVSMKGSHPRW